MATTNKATPDDWGIDPSIIVKGSDYTTAPSIIVKAAGTGYACATASIVGDLPPPPAVEREEPFGLQAEVSRLRRLTAEQAAEIRDLRAETGAQEKEITALKVKTLLNTGPRQPVWLPDVVIAVKKAVVQAMAEQQSGKQTDLGEALEGVLKGLKDLTVPHAKVDELDRAVERNKSDRAVHRKP